MHGKLLLSCFPSVVLLSYCIQNFCNVALRFLVQRGNSVIPKTSHRARMAENAAIFDFSLSDEEMAQIRSLDTDKTFFSWTEAY